MGPHGPLFFSHEGPRGRHGFDTWPRIQAAGLSGAQMCRTACPRLLPKRWDARVSMQVFACQDWYHLTFGALVLGCLDFNFLPTNGFSVLSH